MAFPTNTTVLDAFPSTLNPLNGTGIWKSGNIWTGDVTCLTSGGIATANGSTNYGDIATTASYTDAENYFDISLVGANYYFEAMVRVNLSKVVTGGAGNPDYYSFSVDLSTGSNNWRIYRISGGSGTQLGASYAHTPVAGEKCGISVVGSTITGWLYIGGVWTQATTATDTTWTSGGLGFEVQSTCKIDNFSGGAPSAGGTNVNVNVNSLALSMTPQATTVRGDANVALNPTALAMTAQAVSVRGDANITLNALAMSMTAQAVTVSITGDVNVNVNALSFSMAPQNVSVSTGSNVTVNALAMAMTPQAVAVSIDQTVNLNSLGLTMTAQPVSVSTQANVNVALNALPLTMTPLPVSINSVTVIAGGLSGLSGLSGLAATH